MVSGIQPAGIAGVVQFHVHAFLCQCSTCSSLTTATCRGRHGVLVSWVTDEGSLLLYHRALQQRAWRAICATGHCTRGRPVYTRLQTLIC